MARFHTTIPKGKDFWGWPPALALLFIAAVLLSASAIRIFIRASAIRGEQNALEDQIKKIEAENARLKESLRQTDSREAVERMAKEKLNLKQPGEEVVVVMPDAAAATSSPSRGGAFSRFLPAFLSQFFDFFSR